MLLALLCSAFMWASTESTPYLSHIPGDLPLGFSINISRDVTHFSLTRTVAYISGCNYAGTALFFEDSGALYLVSNKHVVQLHEEYRNIHLVPPNAHCKYFNLSREKRSIVPFVHTRMRMYVTVFPNVTQKSHSVCCWPTTLDKLES